MAGTNDWFYSATPEQQQAYIAQGVFPADYQGAYDYDGAANPLATSAVPPVQTSQWETFDQGRSGPQAGYTGTIDPEGGVTDFNSYLFQSMTPEQQQAAVAKGYKDQLRSPVAQQAPGRAYEASGGDRGLADPRFELVADNRRLIEKQGEKTDDLLSQLGQQFADTQKRNQGIVDNNNRLIDEQDPRNAAYISGLDQLNAELGGKIAGANAADTAAFNDYRGGLQELNTRNDAAIGKLGGVYDQLSTPLQANLTSQAAIADAQALAGQNQALAQLQGAAGGSLDYTSQAAGAYADPRYVAMRDKGLEDLYGVSQGSKDVRVGQADPRAYQAAMDALGQMGELTNPAVTDKENFLYEQARQRWESEMRGVQQAKMSNLRRRGMAGGGAELTSNALTNADISQKRVLADLAAAAGAVDRSTSMLNSYGQLGSELNSQGNQLATGNANRQLQALGMYEQGSEAAQQASFDQAYSRGVAADKASSDNQSTRLGGMIASGNQANAMQDDAFNRGQAADVMSRYNKTFEQDERNALWGRTTDLTGATLGANAQNSNNLSNIFKADTQVTDTNYARDAQGIGARAGVLNTANGLETDQLGRRLGNGNVGIGVNNQGAARSGAITDSLINAGDRQTAQLIGNNNDIGSLVSGNKAADVAITQAVGAAKQSNTGLSLTNISNLWNGAGPNKSGLSDAQLAQIGVSDEEAARRLG